MTAAEFDAALAIVCEHYAAGRQADGEDAAAELISAFADVEKERAASLARAAVAEGAEAEREKDLETAEADLARWVSDYRALERERDLAQAHAAKVEQELFATRDVAAKYAGEVSLLRRTHEPADPDAWVIEDTRRPNGDWSALFWGPDRRGYTTDLARAGRYSRKEAEEQARRRTCDVAHRLADVLPLARPTVDRDTLRRAVKERGTDGR